VICCYGILSGLHVSGKNSDEKLLQSTLKHLKANENGDIPNTFSGFDVGRVQKADAEHWAALLKDVDEKELEKVEAAKRMFGWFRSIIEYQKVYETIAPRLERFREARKQAAHEQGGL
jgi:molecular chaperone DnaK (HSP70)